MNKPTFLAVYNSGGSLSLLEHFVHRSPLAFSQRFLFMGSVEAIKEVQEIKYLVIGKPGGAQMPSIRRLHCTKLRTLMEKQNLKNGTFDCIFAFFGGGGFAVSNADSHEEVYDQLTKYPMFPFFSWEVKPILDWDKTFETIYAMYET